MASMPDDGRRLVEPAALTVAQVTALVQAQFDTLERMAVTGEVSGKITPGGHYFGELRDGTNQLNIVIWKSALARGVTPPETGSQVVAYGRLGIYGARSYYRLDVSKIELAGAGVLLAALEELKRQLAAEGLFDASRKLPLPRLPKRIGLVTSPTGAVIRDMLHRIADRCPRHVLLWPVTVQGPTAVDDITGAIKGFNALAEGQRPDVLIVARGGGSLEDLMAFNHEAVVRAVAASRIPIISGVGHEPDVTLCDFAASLRAPTPTAAAELVVPVRHELLAELNGYASWLLREARNQLQFSWEQLTSLQRLLPLPQRQLRQSTDKLHQLTQRLRPLSIQLLQRASTKLTALERVLLANNPEAPLAKGYAHVSTSTGQTIRSAAQALGEMNLRFADGTRSVVAKTLALLCLTLTTFAAPQITEVRSNLMQGGFYVGEVSPGIIIKWNDQRVPVVANNRFFIGFDRYEPVSGTLKVCDKANCTTQAFTLAVRTYKIQNVEGVPPQTVNPTKAQLKQMAADNKAIGTARKPLTDLWSFEKPLKAPVKGPFSGVYGSARRYNGEERTWHKGLDFAAPTGTAVHAPADGIVTLARSTFMSGNLIILDHGAQLFTAYAHLSQMNVSVGQAVLKGDVIGKVGTTGRSTGPHLHWGAYWKNTAIDPMLLLEKEESPVP